MLGKLKTKMQFSDVKIWHIMGWVGIKIGNVFKLAKFSFSKLVLHLIGFSSSFGQFLPGRLHLISKIYPFFDSISFISIFIFMMLCLSWNKIYQAKNQLWNKCLNIHVIILIIIIIFLLISMIYMFVRTLQWAGELVSE